MKSETVSNAQLLAELVALRAEIAQLKSSKAAKAEKKVSEPVVYISCPANLLVACKNDPKTTPGKNGGLYYKCFATLIVLSGQKKYGTNALYSPATIKTAAAAYGLVL